MKKLLFAIAVTGFLVACNNNKEGEKKVDDSSTTTSTDQTDNPSEPTTNEPTGDSPVAGLPAFSDPEVQKFANEYAAFISEYKKVLADPTSPKTAEFAMQWAQWASKSMSVSMKLASNPEEAKKFSEWSQLITKDLRQPE